MTDDSRDIFISYSSGDEAIARELRGFLDAAGYTCWMAPDDVVGADPWAKQIIRAIETSQSMVVLISSNSNASEHVGREVELAIGRHRPVLPVRIEAVQYDPALEYFLAGTQRVDAHTGVFADHRDRILRRLATIVPRTGKVETPPDPAPARAPSESAPQPQQPLSGAATNAWRDAEERPAPEARPTPEPRATPVPDPVREPPRTPARLGVWARANSMLVGSAVTIAALVIVATGVLAFGQPGPSRSPGTSLQQASPSALATATAVPTPSPTITLPPSLSTSTTFRDGLHTVGVDIAPGTYRLREPAAFCSFQRLRGLGGTSEDAIVDELVIGYAIVTIKPTDKGFMSSDCGEWSSDLSMVTPSRSVIEQNGIYIVGTDISPGTWRSTGGKDCYWARLTGFTRVNEEIIANDIVNVATTVTIHPGDAGFETVRCGAWQLK